MIRLAKKLEKSNAKIAKVKCDIKLSLFCKNNNLTLIFTRPKFAIRLSNYLRNKILRQILETEIRNQHVKKKKLTRQMKENTNNISNNTSFICNIVLYNSIKNTVPKEKCRWDKIYNKKLDKLHSERRYISKPKYCIAVNTINNFSSYILTSEKEYALLFNLDQNIPTKQNASNIISFFYHIQTHSKNLDQELQYKLQIKKRRTCENFLKLKVPHKHQKIIDKLSKNTGIIVLKQFKDRGVTKLNRKDYIQKCELILNRSQFRKIYTDTTKSLERKV